MALHPDIQREAQKEVDTVLGAKVMPDFDDRPNMPYVEAIVKEVLRWQQVTPLGRSYLLKFVSSVLLSRSNPS